MQNGRWSSHSRPAFVVLFLRHLLFFFCFFYLFILFHLSDVSVYLSVLFQPANHCTKKDPCAHSPYLSRFPSSLTHTHSPKSQLSNASRVNGHIQPRPD